MPLTVLSVSYSLAHVSPKTAGGAEQVLATIDEALVRSGHRSLVVAPAGSQCNGLVIPAHIPRGVLDENAKHEARRIFKQVLDRALNEYAVDVVHMHGIDFYDYLPDREVPIVVSLHLPLSCIGQMRYPGQDRMSIWYAFQSHNCKLLRVTYESVL